MTHTFFFHFKLTDWRVKVIAHFIRKQFVIFFISKRSENDLIKGRPYGVF